MTTATVEFLDLAPKRTKVQTGASTKRFKRVVMSQRPPHVDTFESVSFVGSISPPLRSPEKRLIVFASLDGGRLELKRPMLCEVEASDYDRNNFLARFPDADLAASGDTQEVAMNNLKDIIETKYRIFSGEKRLSERLRRQLSVLRSYIRG